MRGGDGSNKESFCNEAQNRRAGRISERRVGTDFPRAISEGSLSDSAREAQRVENERKDMVSMIIQLARGKML